MNDEMYLSLHDVTRCDITTHRAMDLDEKPYTYNVYVFHTRRGTTLRVTAFNSNKESMDDGTTAPDQA